MKVMCYPEEKGLGEVLERRIHMQQPDQKVIMRLTDELNKQQQEKV